MTEPKLRVLIHGKDHPLRCQSGYSIAAKYLIDGLHRDMDLGVYAPVGQKYSIEYYYPEEGVTRTVGGAGAVPIYPGTNEGMGEDMIDHHYQHFRAELLLFLGDLWGLGRMIDLCRQDRIRMIASVPVDFLNPIPRGFVERANAALFTVPWVRDGYDRLKEAGVSTLYREPVPLPIDTDIWKPVSRVENAQAMFDTGFREDAFNICFVGANQYQRKSLDQMLRGIAIFRERTPGVNLRLYVHSFLQVGDGYDIAALVDSVGLADAVRYSDPYRMVTGLYSERDMVLIHGLADVVLNCGLEGFGYSSIQAQATGTPLIGMNAGGTKDVLGYGILVEPFSDYLTPNAMRRADPHPAQVAEALERVYRTARSDFAGGIQFVRDNFSLPVVIPKWRKLFEEVDAELEKRCMKSGRYPPHPSERALEMSRKMLEMA